MNPDESNITQEEIDDAVRAITRTQAISDWFVFVHGRDIYNLAYGFDRMELAEQLRNEYPDLFIAWNATRRFQGKEAVESFQPQN